MADLEQILAPIVAKGSAASLRRVPGATDASVDIFEETLLRMAGIKTKPTFCQFDEDDDKKCHLRYAGLTPEDIHQFTAFMRLPPESVTMIDEANEVIFTIPTKQVKKEIVPAFEKELLAYREKSPEILKPYINPAVALTGMMGAMDQVSLSLEDETCKNEFQTFSANMAEMWESGLGEQGLTSKGFAYESALACKKELQAFGEKHPDLNNNEEIKEGLKDLNNFLDLFLIAIRPAANLAEKDKVRSPGIARFFDESVSRGMDTPPAAHRKTV